VVAVTGVRRDHQGGGEFGRPAGDGGLRRRHRGFELIRCARSRSSAKYWRLTSIACRFSGRAISWQAASLAARPRQRPRLDQPAHLGIEPRHDGMNIAKLATDQAKRCGEVFKIGRHGNSLGDNAAFEVVGMPCSGCGPLIRRRIVANTGSLRRHGADARPSNWRRFQRALHSREVANDPMDRRRRKEFRGGAGAAAAVA
jgi:hypothetical protein